MLKKYPAIKQDIFFYKDKHKPSLPAATAAAAATT